MSWKEWLKTFSDFHQTGMQETGLPVFLVAMAVSLASSFFVAYLYDVFYRSRATGSEIHRAFPLIGISVTAVFITIQFSLPLSLGLLGALSIVRFRTPVKEPEEIAFVLLVVACALCCATFNVLFLGIVLCAAVLALICARFAQRLRGPGAGRGLLVLTLPLGEYREHGGALLAHLAQERPGGGLDSVSESEESASLSYRFRGLTAERVAGLQAGVRAISGEIESSLYFDAPSTG